MLKYLKVIIATLSFSMSAAHASTSELIGVPLDVVGIAIGDSIEDAKRKISQHNSALIPHEVPSTNGGLFGVVAQVQDEKRGGVPDHALVREDFFITPSDSGTVATITHFVRPKDNPFTEEQLVSALTAKYGDFIESSGSLSSITWNFDIEGNQIRPQFGGPCGDTWFDRDVGRINAGGESYPSFGRRISSFMSTCAAVIYVKYRTDQHDIVTEYDVSIADVKTLYADAKARDDAKKAAAEAERAAAIEATKKSHGPTL